jgi:hypothetical protein
MRQLHIGQRVRINFPDSGLHGVVTTIASGLRFVNDDDQGIYEGYDVDIVMDAEDEPDYPGERYTFESHELIPVRWWHFWHWGAP